MLRVGTAQWGGDKFQFSEETASIKQEEDKEYLVKPEKPRVESMDTISVPSVVQGVQNNKRPEYTVFIGSERYKLSCSKLLALDEAEAIFNKLDAEAKAHQRFIY